MPDSSLRTARHVYLTYVHEDSGAASEIARELEGRGIVTRLDQADLAWGESWAEHVRSAVETAATFVLIVSQDSWRHIGDWEETVVALDRRGIDVVPVAMPPPFVQNLAGKAVLDYAGPSAGKRLADRIDLGAAINLDNLSWGQFEALVAELLPRFGFDIPWAAEQTASANSGFDRLRVAHGSPSGQEFLFQVKAYRHSGRISVNEIQRLAALVQERDAHGVLVTTAQLTSVARQVVDRVNATGIRLDVLEGPALRQMLVADPDLAHRHLTASGSGGK